MAETFETMLGRIDERTKIIQDLLHKIEDRQESFEGKVANQQNDMVVKTNALRLDVDTLFLEYNNHSKECKLISPISSFKITDLIPARTLALLCTGAVFGVGLIGVLAVFIAGKVTNLW